MRIRHDLESATARCIWMYEVGLDRTGANQRHLDHDVVQPIRLGVQHRRNLCPALDLKRADRLTGRNQLVGLLVVGWQLVHLGPRSRAHLDHVERSSHQRQRTESQEIELGNSDRIEIILVELDDGAAHRRMLDRHVITKQSGRKHEPTNVGRAQTRHSLEGRHRRQRRASTRIVEIDAQLRRQFLLYVLRAFGWITPVHALGDVVRHLHRIAEGAHRVANGVRAAVHLHDPGDGSLRAIVFAIDVIEHFLSAIVLDVHVDVGRLGLPIDADLRKKSLEQEAMPHRIHGRDGEAVSHRRVGGAAAALTENSLRLGEVHGIPHHEKKSRETEIPNNSQLVLELIDLLLVELAPPLSRTFEDFLVQERVVVVTVRNRKLWQRRTNPREIEIAFVGDALTFPETLLATLPSLRHFLWRDETPLAVWMQQSARDSVVDGGVVTKRCQNVVDQTRAVVDVTRLVADDPRHIVSLCELDQCGTERSFGTAGVMQLDFDGESVSKYRSPPAQRAFGFAVITFAEVRCDRTRKRTGQHLHSFAPLSYLLPRKSWTSPRFLAVSFLPGRELANT